LLRGLKEGGGQFKDVHTIKKSITKVVSMRIENKGKGASSTSLALEEAI